ncbi:MAG: hypothetical protein DRQ40_10020 [Gammaproteobacteria bacterium]|nr:MAG: hypothetical protein DRQ40_10020 [Gammaproteobacteria bacterium]
MKKFLLENPTITFGLGLPLLLVVLFLLISGIPSLLVTSPQYDVLYATEYYNYQNGVQISVIDQKVQVIYQDSLQGRQKPRLWRYDPKTGAVKEITIVLPPSRNTAGKMKVTPEDAPKTTLINIPDLEGVTIDSSSIAPDGYEFSVGRDRYSRNVFGGLFYSSRYRYEAVLTKNGRSIRLPNASGRYYSHNTHFIGWVMSP